MRSPKLGIRISISLAALLAALAGSAPRALAVMDATTECLFEFGQVGDALVNGGALTCTDCDAACDADSPGQANGTCTFNLTACLNQVTQGCSAAAIKTSKVNPKKANLTPADPCGNATGVVVKTKKQGKKAGKLKLKAVVKSTDKRIDKDLLTLMCNPLPAGAACGTTTTTSTTTSTLPAFTCDPIVPGQPILSTYQLSATAGEKLCHGNTGANKYGPCTTDADCGGTALGCRQTPFVMAGAIPQELSPNSSTIFTVTEEGTNTEQSKCGHKVCIGCGNPDAPCAGIPGCVGNPQCVRTTCCDQPRFIVPPLLIAGLGACVRVDQVGCGIGEVNTSNPQVGDNEVRKSGDTSDPGADCQYGTGDDPAPLVCNTSPAGAGSDFKGKIVRTVGDGFQDSPGIHYRLTTPQLSTAWSGEANCNASATFDGGAETILTQLVLQAEATTAGATGVFEDMNGDTCGRALGGSGFGSFGDGPITLGNPTIKPMPYGGGDSVSVAVGIVFSGPSAPPVAKDLGFVAITPNLAPTVLPAETCMCNAAPGCPE